MNMCAVHKRGIRAHVAMLFAIVSWLCMLVCFVMGVVWLNMYNMSEPEPVVAESVHMRVYRDYCGTRTMQLTIVRNITLLCFTVSVIFAFIFIAVDANI